MSDRYVVTRRDLKCTYGVFFDRSAAYDWAVENFGKEDFDIWDFESVVKSQDRDGNHPFNTSVYDLSPSTSQHHEGETRSAQPASGAPEQ